jgi:hypothetical protein
MEPYSWVSRTRRSGRHVVAIANRSANICGYRQKRALQRLGRVRLCNVCLAAWLHADHLRIIVFEAGP